MELAPKFLTCHIVLALLSCGQTLAASTKLHKGGYLKSNANTEVPISSHQRYKRQIQNTGSRISSTEAQALVDKHNIRRRNETASDMEFMIWNNELAAMAQEWADSCNWGHGQPFRREEDLPFYPIGQNLYAWTGQLDLERAMAAWSEEEKIYFNYDTLQCTTGQQCGHYTQIVWAKSKEVGCAYQRCPQLFSSTLPGSATYLVCNYGPAGNYQGVKPFKKGQPCTDCASGNGWCDNGLCKDGCYDGAPNCDCKIQCHNCATATNDCRCTCQDGFNGTSCKERCVDDSQCNLNWHQSDCNKQFSEFVMDTCPAMCGICTQFDEVLHGANENCPITSRDPCFMYTSESLCSNNGQVQFVNNACVCDCNAGYKGTNCNVNEEDIGVLLSVEIAPQSSWDTVWSFVRSKLVTDVTAYCTAYKQKCCGGDFMGSDGTVDYKVAVGQGYPYPDDGSNPFSVLLYSVGTPNNVCKNKELPASVFYEIVKNMEQSLNWTMSSCCGAALHKIREPEMDAATGDDDGGSDGIPLWGYALGAAVGLVFLLIVIVVVVMLVKRKKQSVGSDFYNREAGSRENLGFDKYEKHLKNYENVKISN